MSAHNKENEAKNNPASQGKMPSGNADFHRSLIEDPSSNLSSSIPPKNTAELLHDPEFQSDKAHQAAFMSHHVALHDAALQDEVAVRNDIQEWETFEDGDGEIGVRARHKRSS